MAAIKVVAGELDGLHVVELPVFGDTRGYFFESYRQRAYRDAGIGYDLVQDNVSRSVKGVLRGLHFQVRRPQAQIVTVLSGHIFDVTVDLRPASKTFGRWFGIELSDASGPRQLCMAAGFAHGFYVLSEAADLHYKVGRYYDPEDEGGLLWCDEDVAIRWPGGSRMISPRDASFPRFCELKREQLPHDPPLEIADGF